MTVKNKQGSIGCVLIFLFLFLLPVSSKAAPVSLTVNKGTGTGFYEPGSVVNIFAYPYDTTDFDKEVLEPESSDGPVRIFDRWVGDTTAVHDIWEKDTTLLMPAAEITLTAQFKDVSRWAMPRMLQWVPENPVGLIYFFHGSGGSLTNHVTLMENSCFLDQAASRGFAVAAIESYERNVGLWDVDNHAATENIDMCRLSVAHSQLVSNKDVLDGLPVYLVGISQGGLFASMASQQAGEGEMSFQVSAQALYISSGNYDAIQGSAVPTIFLLAENDDQVDNVWVQANFDELIGRDVPSQIWTLEPSPIHSEFFWGIPGLNQAASQAITAALRNGGFLDNQNFLKSNTWEDSNLDGLADWQSAIPAQFAFFLMQINSRLLVAHAGHSFYCNLDDNVFEFFFNPTTIVSDIPEITSFTPDNGTVTTDVTITGNNFINIQSVTFNGMPAYSYKVHLPTTITAIVPVGMTTGPIEVSNSAGTGISADDFVLTGGPVITSFEPAGTAVGRWVTITGDEFYQIEDVSFNGISAEFVMGALTTIYAKVPDGATTGPIEVTNWLGMVISQSDFTVTGIGETAAVVTGLIPNEGEAGGTLVTISGSNLTQTTEVKFWGQVSAEFEVISDTEIIAMVPPGTVILPVRTVVGIAKISGSDLKILMN